MHRVVGRVTSLWEIFKFCRIEKFSLFLESSETLKEISFGYEGCWGAEEEEKEKGFWSEVLWLMGGE